MLEVAQEARPPEAPTWRERLAPLATRGGWLPSLAVALAALVLRVVRLDLPYGPAAGKVFDEVYYACDAQNLLRYGVEHATLSGDLAGSCTPTGSGSFVVHPPLGKWAIALGIEVFGVTPLGWRSAAALAGALTVLVVVRAGRRLTGSTLLGCLAGVLLALDGLHFVQSRTGMLDVFLVLWTTAAFGCLLVDRDAVRSRLADAGPVAGWGPRLGRRPWRLLAGVCLGAAVATKWSGAYYLAVLVLLALAWEVGARRTAGTRAPYRAVLLRSTVPAVVALVLVPLAVYLLSWTGWFVTDLGWDRHWADGRAGGLPLVPDALRSLWHYHAEVLSFHEGLSSPHPYQSHPAGWLLLARPVSYYYPVDLTAGELGCAAATCSREVLAIGNPALWWASSPVLVALLWLAVTRRDWRAAALLPLVLAAIVPWVRDDLNSRTMFLFYALPAVPFLALATVLAWGWAMGPADASPARRRTGGALAAAHLALVVAAFVWFYPVLAAVTIPFSQWQDRMWFASWV